MIKAVIDLGTNSLKCVIASVEEGKVTLLRDINRVTRLGAELARSGKIGAEAMQRNLQALQEIRAICRELKAESILCVGAETLRRAEDTGVFSTRVWQELGWKVQVLSPEEEAQYSFQASAQLAPPGVQTLVIDSGGGSTEFTLGKDGQIQSRHSLPLGAVVLTSKFVNSDPVDASDLQNLQEHIRSLLEQNFPDPRTLFTIACGGGLTSMAAVSLALEPYDANQVQGVFLSLAELERQVKLYVELDWEERKKIRGLPPDRADIILAGAVLIQEIMKHFQLEKVLVSTYGLRHALLI